MCPTFVSLFENQPGLGMGAHIDGISNRSTVHGVTVPEEDRRTRTNPDGIDVDGDGHPRIQNCIALLGLSGRSLLKLKRFDWWDLLPWF